MSTLTRRRGSDPGVSIPTEGSVPGGPWEGQNSADFGDHRALLTKHWKVQTGDERYVRLVRGRKKKVRVRDRGRKV